MSREDASTEDPLPDPDPSPGPSGPDGEAGSDPHDASLETEDTSEELSPHTMTLSHRLRNRLPFGRQKNKTTISSSACSTCKADSAIKKKTTSRGWAFKLCARSDSSLSIDSSASPALASSLNGGGPCVCTGYRRTDDSVPLAEFSADGRQSPASPQPASSSTTRSDLTTSPPQVPSDHPSPRPAAVAPSPRQPSSPPLSSSPGDPIQQQLRSYRTGQVRVLQNSPADSRSGLPHHGMGQVRVSELAIALRNQLASVSPYPYVARWNDASGGSPAQPAAAEVVSPSLFSRFCSRGGSENFVTLSPDGIPHPQIHTQIDFIHRLVPDMLQISNCSFYWGKMDRYEAEKLLENRPEGTFLLRDSAQEEHLFSVSFRRFDRSLHARIEQWNDRFSFDSHDPGVFSSSTVCGLIEHYKDPSHCMFFEPMLTIPLHRNFPFSLQHLCRATVSSRLTYDSINDLVLPKRIRSFLKEYHYRQQVRIRTIDS